MEDMQEVLIDIRERLVRVETKIDDGLKARLTKLEDNQTWLWRTTIGVILSRRSSLPRTPISTAKRFFVGSNSNIMLCHPI